MKTEPITLEEIALWQESTPEDCADWDAETISDCNEFLTVLLDRLKENENVQG